MRNTLIRYFEHEVHRNADDELEVYEHLTDDRINDFAEQNGLDIVSATCYMDKGIYVVFKKKSTA